MTCPRPSLSRELYTVEISICVCRMSDFRGKLEADKMYLDDLNSGLIVLDEDVGLLSVGNLPKANSASFPNKHVFIRNT